MMVGFGSWQPDTAGLNTKDQSGRALLSIARNVYPGRGGWMPILSLAAFQTGTAFSGTCNGMFAARSSTGGWVIFAGSTTKLFKFNSGTSTWDDYSRVSGGAANRPVRDDLSFDTIWSQSLCTTLH